MIDASAAIEWLIRGPKGRLVVSRAFSAEAEAYAPHLIDLEVAHACRRLVRLGDMTGERGREALSDLADAPIRRVPHLALLDRAWSLKDNFSAYDAAYVALAEALDAELVTLDRRLAKAAEPWVSVLAL